MRGDPKVQKALNRLAKAIPNGFLIAETDPAKFIEVAAEIVEGRVCPVCGRDYDGRVQ